MLNLEIHDRLTWPPKTMVRLETSGEVDDADIKLGYIPFIQSCGHDCTRLLEVKRKSTEAVGVI